MTKIRASCEIIGKDFSPAAFSKTNTVKLADAGEPNEIGKIGRYRNKPTPYGHATIEISNKAEDWSKLDELLTVIESCIESLRRAGAEEIWLSCSVFHDGQCNFGFSKEQLERIAALKIDMPISCYSNEPE